jgi:hypothetical protein
MLAACAAMTAFASDDLVDTAKEAKAKRRKSTTKVITNADVKKAKAKIATTGAPSTPVQPEPTLMEKHVATREAERIAAERKAVAEKMVGELEKELAALEQKYYEENDLDRRDTEIVKRFNATKEKLDAARSELAALSPKPPAPPSP